MNKSLHRQFIKTAEEFSPQLSSDIKTTGMIMIPSRKHQGIGEFLSRVIIGQQLSTKAAATIWQRVREAGKSEHTRVIDYFTEKNSIVTSLKHIQSIVIKIKLELLYIALTIPCQC